MLISAIAILSAPGKLASQEPGSTSLRIISPKENTVFKPGETVQVEVVAQGNLASVMLTGQDPLGFHPAAPTSNGYRSSLRIPAKISPGKYTLTAFGVTKVVGAPPVMSLPVTIDIERFDQLLSVLISPNALQLEVGDEASLTVEGVYADGSKVYLTNSTQTSFMSESPSIATVTRDGFVTGIAVGSTRIRIKDKFAVPVTVKAHRR